VNLSKVVEAPLVAKPRSKAEIAPARNSAGVVRNVAPPKGTNDEIPRHKTTKLPPEVNGNSSCSNHFVEDCFLELYQRRSCQQIFCFCYF
jgi:hypothetical protein